MADQQQVRYICENLHLNDQVELVDRALADLPGLDGVFWFGSPDLFSEETYDLYLLWTSRARALGKMVMGAMIRSCDLGAQEEKESLVGHVATIDQLRYALLRAVGSALRVPWAKPVGEVTRSG